METSDLPHAHSFDALLPTFDDLVSAKLKSDGIPGVVRQPGHVKDHPRLQLALSKEQTMKSVYIPRMLSL